MGYHARKSWNEMRSNDPSGLRESHSLASVQLDTVPGWLPLNRSLGFKAKYENEHFEPRFQLDTAGAGVEALFTFGGNDRPHPNLLPRGKGTAMGCVALAVVRRANPGAGAFWFRGSRRERIGENLTPAISPFCDRKTRRGRHAPSVSLNHAAHHSWPQTGTVSRCTRLYLLLLSLVLLPVSPLQAQPTNSLTCLTNVQQVRELDPETAGENLPVRLSGVVTYYDATLFNLFIQDATAGIFVLVPHDMSPNIAAGEKIDVAGVSSKGDYAPIIKASAIRVLGKASLPVPHKISLDKLFTGLEDSQWIEVSGVVRSVTMLEGRHYLNLAMNGQRVMTYVEDLNEADILKLIHTTIRLRGVCYSRYNMRRQLRVPWLAVSSLADVAIEQPSPKPPKEISMASLAQFNSSGYYGNLVKISGVVTLQKTDGTLFIQNQGCGLCVQVAQAVPLAPGDRVVVLGYSELGQYVPVLEDAIVQLIGHGKPPAAIPTGLETLLRDPEDFTGVLVHLKGTLMNLVENAGRQTLILQSSNSIFTANIEDAQVEELFKSLKLGSDLALTGVFVAQSPEKWIPGVAQSREISVPTIPYSPPESVEILLRSYGDVTVIRQPPWWTLSRLLWTLGIMTLVLLAGLVWVVVLGRRVRQQTWIIEEKVRRAGILEERDRIAREFHDTLEQELAAITIQLDAVEAQLNGSPATVRQLLGLARNMSRRSLSEARRSVWDLRSHLLENGDLAAALTEMAAPLSAASGTEITIQSSGVPRKLPAVTEHNLLRITQEALANALKHSGAKKITVGLNYQPASVQLRFHDNGNGFDLLTVGQAAGGHFGLLDMRERAEKIGARFSLTSQAGHGTEILLLITEAAKNDSPGNGEVNFESKHHSHR
jgi:signal transduction histidine kinase